MTRWSLLTLTLTFAGVCGCAPGPRGTNRQADVDAINKVRDNEVASLAEGHTEGIMTVFTNDALFTPPNEPQLKGNDAIKKWVDRILTQSTATARYTSSEIDVAGDWAIERYNGTMAVTPKKGGPTVEEHFRGVHIYRRQPDGTWRIAQDIWNAEPPAAGNRSS